MSSERRRALVTGITGQDGSYLAELLLEKDYEVFGLVRRSSTVNFERIEHIQDDIHLLSGDLLDQNSLMVAMQHAQPHEIYNLGAQSFVPASWEQPLLTGEITALGVARILEAIRSTDPSTRFYQASTSELFGKVQESPQSERTPFYPRSPYGVSKLYAHWITINYRESYDLFACAGILFNHESPRRGLEFVTRKITHGVARIKHGLTNKLALGNLDARRDWGYAGDFVRAMWMMLQEAEPADYVIATGEDRTIREFCQVAFDAAGLNWEDHVVIDERFLRPAEVEILKGDPSEAVDRMGWKPEVSFEQMVQMMVEHDLEVVSAHK
ncbi:MAG TPA: GDP-mannose 4,6-dehydratase [Candidatus Latescibacteria bacterium]|jgi:GDPmannose 4,6-dehydratase|nr:GDP-mannose 4,6-dehydratase [Gemmatimonadota bacterium]MDP7363690.1 GDP-mannose 4,6-dehydratase [Candidatus Latescibacterota bacterium]MDP7633528.1 GDP-mannose 4,6-dehydratase [Candidatus Latescibacterota bacterium]HCV22684.1 GDP-mannose 4,6-dehydratase [Candidatus Latescibacterota bacterium]HJN26647.1 GDP-mannose 4,6-dehydratase [Candidatus Latescibacterota bacterium]|tara:strand:- start:1608 stop:2585 length:978 start_codon:yes stop_codon:yes gene_type:complete